MTESRAPNPPSPFIDGWIHRLAIDHRGGSALDVACGRGRHALALARAGFRVTALDRSLDALRDLRRLDTGGTLQLACVDLEAWRWPTDQFSVVVVSRYLDRERFDAMRAALKPGGVLLYETFTEHQLRHAHGPRSRAHLLAPGELRLRVRGMDVLYDEEVSGSASVARVAARRRDAGGLRRG